MRYMENEDAVVMENEDAVTKSPTPKGGACVQK